MQGIVNALVEVEQTILRELLRLAELQNARALPIDAFERAGAAVRASLRHHSEQVDRLESLAPIQSRPAEEEQVWAHVRRHRAEGAALASSLRDLASKVRRDRGLQEEAERAALFASAKDGGQTPMGNSLDARAAAQTARDAGGADEVLAESGRPLRAEFGARCGETSFKGLS